MPGLLALSSFAFLNVIDGISAEGRRMVSLFYRRLVCMSSMRGHVCTSRRACASRRRPSARFRTTFYMRDIRFT